MFGENGLPYRRARHGLGAAVAVGRVGLGITALVAPRPMLRMWVGQEAADGVPARVLGRALAGRDLALGALAVQALAGRQPGRARAAIALGAFADGVDLLATWRGGRALPRRRRWLILGITLGATVAGIAAVVD